MRNDECIDEYCDNIDWWSTYPGFPLFDLPTAACTQNAIELRARVDRFRGDVAVNFAWENPPLFFFRDSPPRSVTGQPFAGAGYPGQLHAPALPQHAFRDPRSPGAHVYTYIGRFGSNEYDAIDEDTEHIFICTADHQLFIVGSTALDREITVDPTSTDLFGRDESAEDKEERGLRHHEHYIECMNGYACNSNVGGH